ncbi:MAG: hypothetical protein ACI8TP_003040 [Acidimicrobiales bacterium]|jgi:hypothetical protein
MWGAIATNDSTPVRRELPDQAGHLSASHSRLHVHQVCFVDAHSSGMPVSISNRRCSLTACWSSERTCSASALVLNDLMRSRPSTRHRT